MREGSYLAFYLIVNLPQNFSIEVSVILLRKLFIHSLLAIDYNHLYQISNVLSCTDLCWDLSFTATLQFVTPPSGSTAQLSLQDFYSVKVRVDTGYVIEALMDRKEFEVAHVYAEVVGAGSDEITVREVTIATALAIIVVF